MSKLCHIDECDREAIPGRILCEFHAYPGDRDPKTTGRKAAIAAAKKKREELAKATGDSSDKKE